MDKKHVRREPEATSKGETRRRAKGSSESVLTSRSPPLCASPLKSNLLDPDTLLLVSIPIQLEATCYRVNIRVIGLIYVL